MKIVPGHRFALADHLIDGGLCAHERKELGGYSKDHPSTPLCQQRSVTDELDSIAEASVEIQKDGLIGQRLVTPLGFRRKAHDATFLMRQPIAVLKSFKAARQIA